MYEEFFGMQRRPFSATPDAKCFVPLQTHQGVLDALAVSCERGQGIGVLTGEAGLGKSLVGLRLAFELQPTFVTAFLGHSAYATRRALLQAILFELNRPYDRMGEQELRLELTSALMSLRSGNQGFALIVDEAHRLSWPLLDEVRMLTLLAEAGDPLARVVLIGNRDLEERLGDPELAAFNQRVCCQVDLTPLTQAESREYLRSNLEFAGARPEDIFTDEAMAFLAKAADGVPRCLNHLADHSLLLAFVTERRPVSADIVREALDDLKQLPMQWNDPISGGEIYRGLSQRPAMEDSAVDLWPTNANTTGTEPRESDSWNELAFGDSSAAIEIGGELDDAPAESRIPLLDSTAEFTCLKQDWQAITRQPSSEEALLDDVTELAQSLEDGGESPPFGETFAARTFEFGAPSPRSFAVEEFANDDESPVWNLPECSRLKVDDTEVEFEEEPVIDRYIRIESEASLKATMWNRHTRMASNPAVITAKITRLAMAAAGEADERHEALPLEPESNSDLDSGIVESYSRKHRNVGHVFNVRVPQHDDVASELDKHDEIELHEKREWHLPTELLQATSENDGIEEQIGADVLDMYLDVQQTLIEHQIVAGRPTVPWGEPDSDEVPPTREEFEPNARVENSVESFEPPRATQPDAIQRAYGRLFSELRRKKK